MTYDAVWRRRAVERANGPYSQYQIDAGGRLRRLRHAAGRKVLGDFAYAVDKRGNRTQAVEMLPQASAGNTTLDKDNAAV